MSNCPPSFETVTSVEDQVFVERGCALWRRRRGPSQGEVRRRCRGGRGLRRSSSVVWLVRLQPGSTLSMHVVEAAHVAGLVARSVRFPVWLASSAGPVALYDTL